MFFSVGRLFDVPRTRRPASDRFSSGVEAYESRLLPSASVFTASQSGKSIETKSVQPHVAFPEDYDGKWSVVPQGVANRELDISVKGSKVKGHIELNDNETGGRFKGKLSGPDGVTLIGAVKWKITSGPNQGKLTLSLNVSLDSPVLFLGTYQLSVNDQPVGSGNVEGNKLT